MNVPQNAAKPFWLKSRFRVQTVTAANLFQSTSTSGSLRHSPKTEDGSCPILLETLLWLSTAFRRLGDLLSPGLSNLKPLPGHHKLFNQH